jgi:hypothetical protein
MDAVASILLDLRSKYLKCGSIILFGNAHPIVKFYEAIKKFAESEA